MKLELNVNQNANYERRRKLKPKMKIKSPAKVFSQCPYCESKSLLRFESQVFCCSCEWNSLKGFFRASAIAQARA